MTQIQDNTARIADLMDQIKALRKTQAQAAEAATEAKIEAIRSLMDSDSDVYTLIEVCETHGVTTVAELATIFRMRGPKREMDHAEVERVLNYVRRNPRCTAVEIVTNTGCADDTPRRMASGGHLISWGRARAKRYSVR